MNRNVEDYIKPGARAHLVGIGGVSMAPLAEVLKGKGVEITGSDMRESGTAAHLRSLGIPVTIGHLRHPYRRRPRRQPGDRRRPCRGHPRL